ncbi:MAG: hypothetical protein ACK4UJ_08600 [Leptonema sp. (in: bacteria)]
MKERTKLSSKKFEKKLIQYLELRGIDISISLEDGKVIHLNKNRCFREGHIINYPKKGIEEKIPIHKIKKAEFYIA